MFGLFTGNPYDIGEKKPFYRPQTDIKDLKILSQFSGDSYNCKVKAYSDNTLNFTIKDSPIFGFQSARGSSSFLGINDPVFHSAEVAKKLHYQHLKVIDVVQTSFDGCYNSFLAVKRAERLLNVPVLDESEKAFLKSIRNSLRTDNFKKTKENLFDYVLSNPWDWFFTGTFDKKRYNSDNADELKKVLQSWFKNMVQNYHISYIVIFEYHKNGGIHIHGLIRENPYYPLRLVESGTRSYYGFKKPMKDSTAFKRGLDVTKGKIVYNLKTWRFGWSTAIKFYGKPEHVAKYVTKYITKGNSKIMGRYFWHSQDLDRPNIFFLNINYDDLKLPKFHGFKYLYQSGDSPEIQELLQDIKKDKISLSDYEDINTDIIKKDKIREVKKDKIRQIQEEKKVQYTDWVDLDSLGQSEFMSGWVDL